MLPRPSIPGLSVRNKLPPLAEMIFQGVPTARFANPLDVRIRLRGFRLRVLNELGFVEAQRVPRSGGERLASRLQ